MTFWNSANLQCLRLLCNEIDAELGMLWSHGELNVTARRGFVRDEISPHCPNTAISNMTCLCTMLSDLLSGISDDIVIQPIVGFSSVIQEQAPSSREVKFTFPIPSSLLLCHAPWPISWSSRALKHTPHKSPRNLWFLIVSFWGPLQFLVTFFLFISRPILWPTCAVAAYCQRLPDKSAPVSHRAAPTRVTISLDKAFLSKHVD
jgi:hypothetical protein